MIQGARLFGGMISNLYWLSEKAMGRLMPYLPESRGKPRVDDRRVLSGIIFINRDGLVGVMRLRRVVHLTRYTTVGSDGVTWRADHDGISGGGTRQ